MGAVNARLSQLLRYLERDGVTEVVLRVGHPVSMRTAKGPTDVTARALTNDQLEAIIGDTDLAPLMATRRQDATIGLQAGALRVVARVTRGDNGIAITLTRALPPAPPPDPPLEFDIELELDPPAETKRALATESPVRSVASPRPAPLVPGASRLASAKPGPPPLEPGIDLSFDDMHHPDDHGAPLAPVPPSRDPVQRDSSPAMQRIDPHGGPERRERQDLRATFGAFQRVDLRGAAAPTPKPDRDESTTEATAWADIDLAPPSGKR